jgi:transglutaminase-like putative cysteine protease
MTPKTLRRVYLREAAVMLVMARLAVRVVAPAYLLAWASRPPRRIRRFASDDAKWIAWAIEVVNAKRLTGALCLPQALAAHAMLRRRDIASRLCLGVARANEAFVAHAWVEVGEDVIVGRSEPGAFTRLAEFGGAHP